MLDLLVVYSPVGGGHKAAALATAEAAKARGLTVEILDLFTFAPRIVGDAYLSAHLTGQAAAPAVYGSAYEAANRTGGALDPIRHAVDRALFGSIVDAVVSYAPRAIVATHHLPLVVLGAAREEGMIRAPLFGVVTDYTSHACWVERGVTGYCVANVQAAHELVVHGVDLAQVHTTGIPVRPAFERIPISTGPRPGSPLRLLVTSGGFGVGPLARIVRSFEGIPSAEITVVAGNNTRLRAHLERLVKRYGIAARILGYENDMPARVAEAHVVVGKAGGLTVSETLAAGRAMIVVGAVPGNEKRNEALVVAGGAGVACAPDLVGPTVKRLHDANLIASMSERARALVLPRSADRVVTAALRSALPKSQSVAA